MKCALRWFVVLAVFALLAVGAWPGVAQDLLVDETPTAETQKEVATAETTVDGSTLTPIDTTWAEEGLFPFGLYFVNISEYVSPSSGLLTVWQRDLFVKGRELNLELVRLYQTPGLLYDGSPYGREASPYSYFNGNSWQLDLPWVGASYLHLWRGQQYKLSWSGNEFQNHKNGHFLLTRMVQNWRVSNYTLFLPNGNRCEFDQSGRILSITTPNADSLVFEYDGVPRITVIHDSAGRTITLTYADPWGTLVESASLVVAGAVDKTVRYNYSSMRLSSVVDPIGVQTGQTAGHVTSFTYAATHQLESITYPSGGKSTFSWSTKTHPDYSGYSKVMVSSHRRRAAATESGPEDMAWSYSYHMLTSPKWFKVSQTTVSVTEVVSIPDATKPTGYRTEDQERLREVFGVQESDDALITSHRYLAPSGTELRRFTYTYNENNERDSEVETRHGSATYALSRSWTYDTWGNVVEATDELGHSKHATYSSGDPVPSSWPASNQFSTAENAQIDSNIRDRVLGTYEWQDSDSGGTALVEAYFTYYPNGNLLGAKQRTGMGPDSSWAATAYRYTSDGDRSYGPTSITRGSQMASGAVTTNVEFDQTHTYPWKQTLTVDSLVTDPEAGLRATMDVSTEQTFDFGVGLVKSQKDGNGRQTDFQYDALGRLTLVIYPQRAAESGRLARQLEYPVVNGVHCVVESWGVWDGQALGSKSRVTRHLFDGLGRRTKTEVYATTDQYLNNAPEYTEDLTYNWQGKVTRNEVTRSDTSVYVTTRDYDLLGRVMQVVNPDESSTLTEYDDAADWDGLPGADGYTVTATDERGHRKQYCYDWVGRLKQVRQYPQGTNAETTEYTYDQLGNLTKVKNPRRAEIRYSYDCMSRLVGVTYPMNAQGTGTVASQAYDGLGRLSSRTDQKGVEILFAYDQLDHLLSRSEKKPGQSPLVVETFGYDRAGNLAYSSNTMNTSWRVHDELNRLLKERVTLGGRTYLAEYQYDQLGLPSEVRSPSAKQVLYQYDAAGRLQSVRRGTEASSPLLATFTYHPMGAVRSIFFGNGVTTDYGLKADRPWIDHIRTYLPEGDLLNLTYSFAPDGDILGIGNGAAEDFFEYDGLGRLTNAVVY